MDLLDWFRGVHAWPSLMRLISRLPSDGHYKAELAQDMEYARRLVQMEEAGLLESPEDGDIPLRGYGPTEQRLDLIADLLQVLYAAQYTSNGQKQPQITPISRPVTALEKARNEVRLAELTDLASFVLGASDM